MTATSKSLALAVICLVVVGWLPCLGWVQWIGAFFAAGALLHGGLGLLFDRDATGAGRGQLAHLAAIVAGLLGGGLGMLRLGIGCGLF